MRPIILSSLIPLLLVAPLASAAAAAPLVHLPWLTSGCVKGSARGRCVQEQSFPVPLGPRLVDWVRFIQHTREIDGVQTVSWGMADADGRTVVPPRYEQVVPIDRNAALVWDGDAISVVASGRIVGSYDEVHTIYPGQQTPMVSAVRTGGGLAVLGPDGVPGPVVPGGESFHHLDRFLVIQSRSPDGVELSTFLDLTGQPTWLGPRVEVLGCDTTLWPTQAPRAAVRVGTSPLPFGDGLVVPIDPDTLAPMELPEGVLGFVAHPDEKGCTSAWVAVSREDGALRYRVSVVPPAALVTKWWDGHAVLDDVVRVFEQFGSTWFHKGYVAGRLPDGRWIAAPGERPELVKDNRATGPTPRDAVWATVVAADERRRAEHQAWLAAEAARADREAATRATAAAEVERLLTARESLDRARGLAIFSVGSPELTLRVLMVSPARTPAEAEAVCRADSGVTCQLARGQVQAEQQALMELRARQDAALRTHPMQGVTVRTYDARGNYLGESTLSPWQADIVTW